MKRFETVFALILMNVALIVFCLSPGINKAKQRDYVRYYENVDELATSTAAPTDTTRRQAKRESQNRKREKKYDKEVLNTRSSKVSGKMFSRAMQYLPETDTMETVVVREDSTAVNP